MGKKYKNPPIVEAICEFRFEPDSPWDLVMPGLIYEKVRDTFGKRRQKKEIGWHIEPKVESIVQRVQTRDLMQFLREDESALAQVGPHLLSVNHLKPYRSWQEFLPLIRKGFEAYCEVVEPTNIQRIGLRYVNRIEIPHPRVELEDYFEFYPYVGSNLPQEHGPFTVGIQVPCEDSRDILKVVLTSANTKTLDTMAFILDLDYFLVQPEKAALDQIFEWVDVAHNHVEDAFEACITDRLGQIFEEVVD